MSDEHSKWMRLAIAQADLARGNTGDNPWVGCVFVNRRGDVLGVGHTRGPGEAHAEVAAALDAHGRGHSVIGATLYSTLEPCSFHGRTPACAVSIASCGVATVVTGMRDPHPRVNGAGVAILRSAGVHVIEGVCEGEVMRQLGHWLLSRHPQALVSRVRQLPAHRRVEELMRMYGIEQARAEDVLSPRALPSRE